MPTFGSSTSPSFSGWDWIGTSGYAFAGKWTSPSSDIYITALHAYFDTFAGSGAQGYLCVWSGSDASGNPLLAITSPFTINNGSKSPGGQQWWTHTLSSPLFVPASTPLWLGAYSTQGLIFSTYDTSPNTYTKSMGATINPSFFNTPFRSNTGQGPPGAYADYSPVVYGSMQAGGSGGVLIAGSKVTTPTTGIVHMGSNGGGIAPVNFQVTTAGQVRIGNNRQSGLNINNFKIITPKIWVWRP